MLAVIARAVHHAHQRGVLHRDLKPANILVDEAGEPHVADFGLARRLDEQATGDPGVVVGTLCYMAPEQASAEGGPPTCAADIYSLGVIFYELLTGELPFAGTTVEQLLDQLGRSDPLPPRALAPAISTAYQNICLKSLEKDPGRRYRSAAALADDLERAARGEPTEARAPTFARRARGWARRHPRARFGLITAAATTLMAVMLVLAVWRARAVEEAHLLDTNAFIASGQAGAALFQLRAFADRVERAARHPLVISLLASGQVVDPAPRDMAPLATGFDSVFLVNNGGRVLADWPSTAPQVFQRNYAFRDYFRGARKLAEAGVAGAYVARAYRSESRGRLEFAISAPVTDAGGVQLGLIVAPFQAKAAFGGVRIQEGRLRQPADHHRPAGPTRQ
jgi:serine/threonine-protein kinase